MSNYIESKTNEVESLRKSFTEATSCVLADYRGVKAEEMTALRAGLRNSNARLKVIKNTLATLAVKDTDCESAHPMFKGPMSVAFGFGEDIGAPAKVILDFAKKNKNLEVVGAIVDGAVLDKAGVKQLADMPPKPVVQSMLLGVLQAPARNFMGVLEGVGRKWMYVLTAIADKKKEEGQG